MKSSFVGLGVVAVALVVGGCKNDRGAASAHSGAGGESGAQPAAERAAPSSPPSAGHPWSRGDVEAWVKGDLGLVEVNLTPAGGDNYSGSGKGDRGTPYTLKVTQGPGKIVCEHRSPAPTAPGKFVTGTIQFGK